MKETYHFFAAKAEDCTIFLVTLKPYLLQSNNGIEVKIHIIKSSRQLQKTITTFIVSISNPEMLCKNKGELERVLTVVPIHLSMHNIRQSSAIRE